jgi:hypothetical protein
MVVLPFFYEHLLIVVGMICLGASWTFIDGAIQTRGRYPGASQTLCCAAPGLAGAPRSG